MRRSEISIDWVTVGLWAFFVLFGWINIYAASVKSADVSIFNTDYSYGKQFIFILITALVCIVILYIDTKFLEATSYLVYGLTAVLLVLVLIFGREVNGAKGWLDIGGPFKLQPAEFAKIGTAMAIARYMSGYTFSLRNRRDQLILLAIVALPPLLILLQPDMGSVLVFMAFVLVLFREGLSPVVLIAGVIALVVTVLALMMPQTTVLLAIGAAAVVSFLFIARRRFWGLHVAALVLYGGLALGVDWAMTNLLKPHQQTRVKALFNPSTDPLGTGWNITQSKIAIGSGGVSGKGFLNGTQTKFDFVPQQDTDFIFCTIGEEYGWLGSSLLLILFMVFLWRIFLLAEKSRSRYARVYGYSVGCIMFMHIAINIGMAIGVAPVIGIPLPFFSYGGSSLLSFSVLLFLLLNEYANRHNVLGGERVLH